MLNFISIEELYEEADINIKFNEKTSLLYGVNGSFKTTVLEIISSFTAKKIMNIFTYPFSKLIVEYFKLDEYEVNITVVNKQQDENYLFQVTVRLINEGVITSEEIHHLKISKTLRNINNPMNSIFYSSGNDLYNDSKSEDLSTLRTILTNYPIGVNYLPVSRMSYSVLSKEEYIDSINKLIYYVEEEVHEFKLFAQKEFRNHIFNLLLDTSVRSTEFDNLKDIDKHDFESLQIMLEQSEFSMPDINKKLDQVKNEYNEAYEYYKDIPKNSSIKKGNPTLSELRKSLEYAKRLNKCSILFDMIAVVKDINAREHIIRFDLDRLLEILNLLFKQKGNIVFKVNDGRLRAFKGNNDIPIEALSEGERQLIYLLANAYLNKTGFIDTIVIDEPELSLHVSWQYDIIRILQECNNNQIIVATHSPQIVANQKEHLIRVINKTE